MYEDLDIYIKNEVGLTVAIKKWYTGEDNVALIRGPDGRHEMRRFKTLRELKVDKRDRIIEFRYIKIWSHKSVLNEIRGLKLNYPLVFTRKY